MTNFTPLASLLGGILIGLGASAMLLCTGKIAGISGIVGGLLPPARTDVAWRVCFLGGLICGGIMLALISPAMMQIAIVRSTAAMIVAGAAVGYGSRLANGCTSGHGVCGIGRLSVRSMAATATFMSSGALVVYVVRHLLGGAV
jgi:uncharacterized membrane protein YedE/YeeE